MHAALEPITDKKNAPALGQARNRTGSQFNKPSLWQGLALAAVVAVIAMLLGERFPIVGGAIFAIVFGMLIRNTMGVMPVFLPGIRFASKQVLQLSIIALGFGLSIQQVVKTGLDSMGVTLVTIAVAFLVAFFVGRLLSISSNLKTLIGVGTAICGGSAIAAVSPVIQSEEHETALAISTIFIFNVVAVVVFPFFGHWFAMSDLGFGMWAGTAINDTSSVVAAAYSYSQEAGDYATIVKLTRATFIIPICLFYVYLEWNKQKKSGQAFNIKRLIPWFIVWFVMASVIRSTDILPEALLITLAFLAKFLMILALAAIGLSSDLRIMTRTGWQPIFLGLVTWIAVSLSSLAVQHYIQFW